MLMETVLLRRASILPQTQDALLLQVKNSTCDIFPKQKISLIQFRPLLAINSFVQISFFGVWKWQAKFLILKFYTTFEISSKITVTSIFCTFN